MHPRRTRFTGILVATLACCAMGIGTASAAPAPRTTCPTQTHAGRQWTVTVQNTSCPLAKVWLRKLASSSAAGRWSGPPGWTCTRSVAAGGGASGGTCRLASEGKVISWTRRTAR